ncbi:MAG: hypothetical protein ACLUYV_04250 [Alistipes shahii]
MQEEQTFYPVTTEYFTACLPLLEKYFGITAGYFNKELSNAKCLIPHREGNIVKYSIKEDCNLVVPFRHLECHDLLSLINSYGTITPIIEEALLLVAYCIRERQIDENEYNDSYSVSYLGHIPKRMGAPIAFYGANGGTGISRQRTDRHHNSHQ